MSGYFLGIDGGGTKTTAKVCDGNGNIITETVGGSINYYGIGTDKARANLSAITKKIGGKTGIFEFRSVFIGLSALYTRATAEELEKLTGGIINSDYIGMDSDLFIALEATGAKGECAVCICGTGSMSAARKADGSIVCRGGYGYILGDEGSAYKIALEGLRRGILAYDDIEEKTALSKAILDYFKISKMYDIIDLFYDPPMDRDDIARFARVVAGCAGAGDKTAVEITESAAKEIAATVTSLLREFASPIPVGLYGGVFENDAIFNKAFKEELNRLNNGVKAELLPMPPVSGALLAAFNESGTQVTESVIQKLKI
ncbi:MAG: hypothetical protein FWF08_02320 [Oscillospiraceae bacterium]|nr:hypothetical protein [Oscillospiraceae bacterium]